MTPRGMIRELGRLVRADLLAGEVSVGAMNVGSMLAKRIAERTVAAFG